MRLLRCRLASIPAVLSKIAVHTAVGGVYLFIYLLTPRLGQDSELHTNVVAVSWHLMVFKPNLSSPAPHKIHVPLFLQRHDDSLAARRSNDRVSEKNIFYMRSSAHKYLVS